MTRIKSVHVMWRWRSVIAAGVLIGVVVGWMSAPGTAATATDFQATHTLIADPQGGEAFLYRAAVLARLGAVPGRVASRLGIDRRLVQSMVSTETPVGVGLLLITGRSADRAQAEALANVTAAELIVELGGPKSPLHTLEPAVASPVPTDDVKGPGSHPGRALLLGAFGLLLGVGGAFGVERFDNRIRSKHTAEDALGIPVVAEVPPIPRSDRGRLQSGAHPSAFVEAYRGLRTSVERWTPGTGGDDGHRVIVVTSPTGGEGKTTTVAHLAVSLAEIGHSVLVVSADLRRPRLHRYFDRPGEPGLADILRGAPDARRVTDLNLATAIRGVRFVASGAPVGNPAPLLDSAGDVLRDARSLADFVLVDSPPLLTTSDAAQLADSADGVLLVVRAGNTSIGAAARSAELLQRLGIPVLGAVLVAGDGVRVPK
ncbi:MAG TPA: CpsD/CapB family tyrosine-protein kinase [Acidimicrobiia bacterium]|nr:CpsD/CapB family tyrosine-protein kinase [Acidimicrobiia bacterium]